MAQVQGEEIYLSHSGQEIDDNIDEVQAARGSEASLSARLADIVSDFETDQQRQETEIGVVAALGAKNLLENTVAVGTQTIRGVSVTVNADGSVDIGTGTVTGGNLDLHTNTGAGSGMITGEKYILSGCPQGGSASTYRLNCTGVGYETGEGKEFTYGGVALDVYLRVYSGQTISSPLHFAPMIRRAEITDDSYVPYAPTNRELYETGQQSYDFIFALGTALNSNDDLNNYNKVGKIYAATGAIAATISNTPWTLSGFMVITIPMLTATTFIQFLLPNTSGGKWYKRRYTTGAWSAWTEYDGTQVSASQPASSASLMQAGRIDAELTDVQEVTGNDT